MYKIVYRKYWSIILLLSKIKEFYFIIYFHTLCRCLLVNFKFKVTYQFYPHVCFESIHRRVMLYTLDSVQDFFIKLDMKPWVHLVETSSNISKFVLSKSFLCVKNWSNLSKKKFYEEYLTRRPTFIKIFFWKFWFLRYFIS